MARIYVLRVVMSSSERIEHTEEIDDMTKKIRYAFDKETRGKIEKVRNKYKDMIYSRVVSFYGLQLVDESKIDEIRRLVNEADRELRNIHPTLAANHILLPISEEDIERGELYEKVLYAIQYQIVKEVYNRVKNLKSDSLKESSKKALLEYIEEAKALNILQDKSVDELLMKIEKMLELKTSEIKKTILQDLEYIQQVLSSL